MVTQDHAFSRTSMLQEKVMGRRIRGSLKAMLKGQPVGIDERRGGLDKGQTIFGLRGIGIRRHIKMFEPTDIKGKSFPLCVGMIEGVVDIEESELESAIDSQRCVEYATPLGIGQIPIDRADDVI